MVKGGDRLHSIAVASHKVMFRKHRSAASVTSKSRRDKGDIRVHHPRSWRLGTDLPPPNMSIGEGEQITPAPLQLERLGNASLQPAVTRLAQLFAGLSNRFGSDKASFHTYEQHYADLLLPLSLSLAPVKIMEIGLHQFASMKMWQRIFPSATRIVGLDIANHKMYHTEGSHWVPPLRYASHVRFFQTKDELSPNF